MVMFLVVLAAVLFLLSAAGFPGPSPDPPRIRVNLQSAGLFFLTAAYLVAAGFNR